MEVHRDLVDKPIPIDLLVRKGLRTKQVRRLHFYSVAELGVCLLPGTDRTYGLVPTFDSYLLYRINMITACSDECLR